MTLPDKGTSSTYSCSDWAVHGEVDGSGGGVKSWLANCHSSFLCIVVVTGTIDKEYLLAEFLCYSVYSYVMFD